MTAANTLKTDTWTVLYNLLTDVTNGLTDPNSRGILRTAWVFSTYPDPTGSNFPNYPIVTVEIPETSNEGITLPQAVRVYDVEIPIMVFTKSNKNCKTVADNVWQILNDYQSTAQTNKMMRLTLEDGGHDVDIINDVKVHTYTYLVGYKYSQ